MKSNKIAFNFEGETFILKRLTIKALFKESVVKLLFKVKRQGGVVYLKNCHLKTVI